MCWATLLHDVHCQCHSRFFPASPKTNKIPTTTTSVKHCSLGLGWFGVKEDFAYLPSARQGKARGISNSFNSSGTMKIPTTFETGVCLHVRTVTKRKLYPVQRMITMAKFSSSSVFTGILRIKGANNQKDGGLICPSLSVQTLTSSLALSTTDCFISSRSALSRAPPKY